MTILGPDGEPMVEAAESSDKERKTWLKAAAAVGAVAVTITTVFMNMDQLLKSPFFASVDLQIVKIETAPSQFYVTLRNTGGKTALLTGGEVVFDTFLETDAPLRSQLSAITSSWTAELEVSPSETVYPLDQLNIELKADETVVFTVKLRGEDGTSFACVRGHVSLDSADGVSLQSEPIVVLMGDYVMSYATAWRMKDGEKDQYLVGRDDALQFASDILGLGPAQESHAARFARTLKEDIPSG